MLTLPSVIAAACVHSAVRGLKLSSAETALEDICRLVNAGPQTLELLVDVIDSTIEKITPPPPQSPIKCDNDFENQPNTPTEVENVYF